MGSGFATVAAEIVANGQHAAEGGKISAVRGNVMREVMCSSPVPAKVSTKKLLLGFALSFGLCASSADAYGIVVESTTGANLGVQFKVFEKNALDKLAAALKEAHVSRSSRIEVSIDQNGKVGSTTFLTEQPSEIEMNELTSTIKSLEFGTIPGIEEGTVALSFSFGELASPPYRLNSLSVRSAGSITSGDVNASGAKRVPGTAPGAQGRPRRADVRPSGAGVRPGVQVRPQGVEVRPDGVGPRGLGRKGRPQLERSPLPDGTTMEKRRGGGNIISGPFTLGPPQDMGD